LRDHFIVIDAPRMAWSLREGRLRDSRLSSLLQSIEAQDRPPHLTSLASHPNEISVLAEATPSTHPAIMKRRLIRLQLSRSSRFISGKQEVRGETTIAARLFCGQRLMTDDQATITQLLQAWGSGNQEALEQLTPRVYQELHRLARGYMRKERAGNTLQATALVNEAFLRLVDVKDVQWQDRAHFFAICANIMRRILVDRARAKAMDKRGNAAQHINLDDAPEIASGAKDQDLVAVDDALQILERVDPRKAKIVELKFFGGLTVEETAEVLRVSPQTVMRDWKMARAWLMGELAH